MPLTTQKMMNDSRLVREDIQRRIRETKQGWNECERSFRAIAGAIRRKHLCELVRLASRQIRSV